MADLFEMKQELIRTTMQQIASCRYCTEIVNDSVRAPIHCTKFSGSSVPISVNITTCITCGEYKAT
jgi:hypothetical protein